MGAWRVWHGPATHQEVEVFVEWKADGRPAGNGAGPEQPTGLDESRGPEQTLDQTEWSLRGPQCVVARTLPASFRFRREERHLWRSTIVDPCFWSPDFPARYVVTGSAPAPSSTTVAIPAATVGGMPSPWRTEIAVRQWGVRGGRFSLNGRRWVWRAVGGERGASTAGKVHAFDPLPWQDTLLSKVLELDDLDSAIGAATLNVASTHGIALAVRLRDVSDLARLTRYAHSPALLFAILPAGSSVTRAQARSSAPNLLFLAEFATEESRGAASEWRERRQDWWDGAIGPADAAWLAAFRTSYPDLPLVARRDVASLPLSDAREGNVEIDTHALRRLCEQMQAELLSVGDLDGYIVQRRGEGVATGSDTEEERT